MFFFLIGSIKLRLEWLLSWTSQISHITLPTWLPSSFQTVNRNRKRIELNRQSGGHVIKKALLKEDSRTIDQWLDQSSVAQVFISARGGQFLTTARARPDGSVGPIRQRCAITRGWSIVRQRWLLSKPHQRALISQLNIRGGSPRSSSALVNIIT